MLDVKTASFRPTKFPPRDIAIEKSPDGTLRLAHRMRITPSEATLPDYLRRHAARRPDAGWLFQRTADKSAWRSVTFGAAQEAVDNLAHALLALDLPPGAPLAILSGNSIEHALITLAAMRAGTPVAPLSPAYSLRSKDFAKLRSMFAQIRPAAIFVQNASAYASALEAVEGERPRVITVEGPRRGAKDLSFAELSAPSPGRRGGEGLPAVDGSAVARFMFTSGSTGSPKAVIQTHKILCVAAEAGLAAFGEQDDESGVKLDWAPWNHVFGSSMLTQNLVAGGRFYIDEGKPDGPQFAETVRNLREVATTSYANVPAGYVALTDALEADDALAQTFFSRLRMLIYAGARLPDEVAKRMQALAVRQTGFKVPFVSGFGSTETGPGGACVYWETDRVGLIGLPQPGFDLKLVPIDSERFEVRVRGESVTPGYHGQPDLTRAAFDEEGFYKMGDAATFVDPSDLLQGLLFAGRLSEDFKLQTGIFVRVAALRVAVLDCTAPLLHEVVVCGENEAYVAVMAWLNREAASRWLGVEASHEQLNREPRIHARIREALRLHNARGGGSSMRVARALLLDAPASFDAGEATDKGAINASAVRRNRKALVDLLFAHDAPEGVIEIEASTH